MTEAISTFLTALILGGVFQFLRKASRQSPRGDEERLLAYSRGMRLFVLGLWLSVLALIGGLLISWSLDGIEGELSEVVLIGGFLTVLMIPLQLEVSFVRIRWEDDRIWTQSPWRSDREIPMSDITQVDHSAAAQWHRIHTKHHGIVRLHDWISGKERLLHFLQDWVEVDSPLI